MSLRARLEASSLPVTRPLAIIGLYTLSTVERMADIMSALPSIMER